MFQQSSNIAVFSLAYSPFEGGAEIAAREVIRRLKGLNFTVFTYKFNRDWLSEEIADNAEIIRLGRGKKTKDYYGRIWDKIFYIFSAWRKAEELHRQKRFEAIWAIMASYGGIAALFFKLKHPKIPLLLTIQEGDSEKHLAFGKLGLVGLFSRWLFQSADYIQVISNYLKNHVRQKGAGCPMEVIPNGVDLELFSTRYQDSEIKAVRNNLGLKDEYVIVTASRLVYKNGIDILLRAIAKLKEKRFIVKCLIIGGGPEYKKLKKQSEKLIIDGQVIFLGQMPQRDLPLYFEISDIFVRPSRSEGLGNSFLEAMAAGLPVIGTPVGGIVDFLQNNQTGLYANVNDPDDLAKKIQYFLENPLPRERIVQNAKAMVRENYSWDKIAKLFRNIFDKLINL